MKVLIIDDSKLFHNILNEVFSSEDSITPVICNNLSEGMKKLTSEKIDFICVSMHLEDGDGISLTKAVRESKEHKHTPVVLFTSEESHEVYVNALKSGVTEVFHKKDIQQLINFIQRFTLQQQPIAGRILYVEDTLSQRAVITSIFTKRGLTVDAFSTAEAAWESFIEHDYDLVVTDIVLEGSMTGMTLTNHIRRLDGDKGDTPILALTGFDDISRRIELFSLGVSDYVIKPLIEHELLARVRNLIASKQFHTESLLQKRRAENADNAKSDFLSKMSHELRTPLNAILGFAQVLEMDAHEYDDAHNNYVKEIFNAGEHLLALINEMLDLTAIEAGKIKLSMEGVDVDKVLGQCLSLVQVQADMRGLEFIDKIKGNGYRIEADFYRLKQVMLNLLSNAVKYNREQGTITLNSKVHGNNYLRIGISDTGFGLSKSDVDKLFTPFERLNAKTEVEGTGIGLVITKNLVELMGGQIGVDSEINKGTCFWVDFKLVTA